MPWKNNYHDNYQPLTQEINGQVYECVELSHHILKNRRKNLGLTQQQVADAAEIKLRQYQRFESGERDIASSSMRIGLSVCSVLQLDPYRFVFQKEVKSP